MLENTRRFSSLALRWVLPLVMALQIGGIAGAVAGSGFDPPSGGWDPAGEAWRGVWAIEKVHVVSMVPGAKRVHKRQTVVIRDGHIEVIGKAKRVAIPADARVIKGKKKYLIPGLIDSHNHLWMGDGRFADFDEKDLWTLFLANGITTVYELVGADLNNRVRPFLFDWKNDINGGSVVGPDVLIASPRARDDLQRTFPEIDAAVEQWARLGFDSIKVHAPNSLPNYLRLFEQAEKYGLEPIGHPPYRSPDVPVETVLERQRMVAHTHLLMNQFNRQVNNVSMTAAEMRNLARQVAEAGTIFQPTVATIRIFYYHLLDSYWNELIRSDWLDYFPRQVRESWVAGNGIRNGQNQNIPGTKLWWEAILSMTQELHKAGVPLIAGSDSGGIDMTPHGFFLHHELRSLSEEVGLTPWQALAAATHNNAEFIRRTDRVGTIEVGKRADLVLLTSNPVKNVRNLEKISGVMTRGHWIPRKSLDSALEDLRMRMASANTSVGDGKAVIERDTECHGPAAVLGVNLTPAGRAISKRRP